MAQKWPLTARNGDGGFIPLQGSTSKGAVGFIAERKHTSDGAKCADETRWTTNERSPMGGGGAWPGFETTRRAKLAARTASGRAAAHGRTKQPGPTAGSDGARNTSGATSSPAQQAADNDYDSETSPHGSRRDSPR